MFSQENAQHLNHVAYRLVRFKDLRCQRLFSTESEQLTSQSAGTIAGPLDLLKIWAALWAGVIQQEIAIPLDDHYQVIKIVCHSTG